MAVSTSATANTASGKNTARKRRATRSKIRFSSSLREQVVGSTPVGMMAWWSETSASSTTRWVSFCGQPAITRSAATW